MNIRTARFGFTRIIIVSLSILLGARLPMVAAQQTIDIPCPGTAITGPTGIIQANANGDIGEFVLNPVGGVTITNQQWSFAGIPVPSPNLDSNWGELNAGGNELTWNSPLVGGTFAVTVNANRTCGGGGGGGGGDPVDTAFSVTWNVAVLGPPYSVTLTADPSVVKNQVVKEGTTVGLTANVVQTLTGKPVPNLVVTFSTATTSDGTLTATTATTDANGNAPTSIAGPTNPDNTPTYGTPVITATVTATGGPYFGKTTFNFVEVQILLVSPVTGMASGQIQGSVQSFKAGHIITLTGKVKPDGLTITNDYWNTYSGDALESFDHSEGNGGPNYLPTTPTGPSVYFCGWDRNLFMTYCPTVNGTDMSSDETSFGIDIPNVSMSDTLGASSCDTNYALNNGSTAAAVTFLHYGDPAGTPGITVNMTMDTAGDYFWLQSGAVINKRNNDGVGWEFAIASGLDGAILPCATNAQTATPYDDSPGINVYTLDGVPGSITLEIDAQYDPMHLTAMYIPCLNNGGEDPSSTMVPVGTLDWQWVATASRPSATSTTWTVTDSSLLPHITGTLMPAWSSNITDTLNVWKNQ